MTTRSTLGYFNDSGEFRGTYIHADGMAVGRYAAKVLETHGFDFLVDWIEAGIAGGGYSAFGVGQEANGSEEWAVGVGEYFGNPSFEFGWAVEPDAVKTIEAVLHEQKELEIAYWDCYLEAEEIVDEPDIAFDAMVHMKAFKSLAAERFQTGSATYDLLMDKLHRSLDA